jgi:hypothetical protein
MGFGNGILKLNCNMACCIYFAHTEEGRKCQKEFEKLCLFYQNQLDQEDEMLIEAEAKLKETHTEEERKKLELEIYALKTAHKEGARYQAFLEFTNKDK